MGKETFSGRASGDGGEIMSTDVNDGRHIRYHTTFIELLKRKDESLDYSRRSNIVVGPFKHVSFDAWHNMDSSINYDLLCDKIDYAFSIIMTFDPLKASLWKDPKYCTNTHHITACEVVQGARRRMRNRYYDNDKISTIFKRKRWPVHKTNKPDDEGDTTFRSELMDAVFEAQERVKSYFEMREIMRAAEYDYDDETGDETFIEDPERRKKARLKALRLACMPDVSTTYERVVNLPEPFLHWDERSSTQQFFFMADHNGEISCATGAGCSSGRRANHSHYSHIFHHLNEQKKVMGTTLLRYDHKNILRHDHTFSDEFLGFGGDFWSNYTHSRDGKKIPTVRYATAEGSACNRRILSIYRGGDRYDKSNWKFVSSEG